MKKMRHLALIVLALPLLAFAAGCSQDPAAFQVNDVASDPAAFSGQVTVVGITYGYSKSDPSVIGIMDKKELQCTTPNCNKLLLPVKVQGPLPAIGDEIRVSGSFSREPGGYLFRALELKVLANHNVGGQG